MKTTADMITKANFIINLVDDDPTAPGNLRDLASVTSTLLADRTEAQLALADLNIEKKRLVTKLETAEENLEKRSKELYDLRQVRTQCCRRRARRLARHMTAGG